MVLGVGGVFIAVGIDAAVAVANGGCIDDNDDDVVVGIGAGGEFVTGGWRWPPHRKHEAFGTVAVGGVGGDVGPLFLVRWMLLVLCCCCCRRRRIVAIVIWLRFIVACQDH